MSRLLGPGAGGAADGGLDLTTKGDIHTYSTTDIRLAVGSDGQVLTADSGEATGIKWAASAGGTEIGGRIELSSDTSITTSAFTVLPFNTSGLDVGSFVDTGNNGFTVPSGGAGLYGFSCSVMKDSSDTDARARLTVNSTAVNMFLARSKDYKADDVLAGATIVVDLAVSDVIRVEYFFQSSGNVRGSTTTLTRCVFTGWKI